LVRFIFRKAFPQKYMSSTECPRGRSSKFKHTRDTAHSAAMLAAHTLANFNSRGLHTVSNDIFVAVNGL